MQKWIEEHFVFLIGVGFCSTWAIPSVRNSIAVSALVAVGVALIVIDAGGWYLPARKRRLERRAQIVSLFVQVSAVFVGATVAFWASRDQLRLGQEWGEIQVVRNAVVEVRTEREELERSLGTADFRMSTPRNDFLPWRTSAIDRLADDIPLMSVLPAPYRSEIRAAQSRVQGQVRRANDGALAKVDRLAALSQFHSGLVSVERRLCRELVYRLELAPTLPRDPTCPPNGKPLVYGSPTALMKPSSLLK